MAAGAAVGLWTVSAINDTPNNSSALADTLPAGNQPTLSGINGEDVTIAWPASTTVSGGHAVTGYTVNRFSTPTGGTPTAATGGCAGTITALACTEQTVSPGT